MKKQGKQNEQTTLKPLETKVIRDFACSKFIFCPDAGLGSKPNRRFNSFGNRSYVITQKIRGHQLSRAVKMIGQPDRKRRSKNQNDPAHFIKSTAITEIGEVAGKNMHRYIGSHKYHLCPAY